jgi:hypothetical protein
MVREGKSEARGVAGRILLSIFFSIFWSNLQVSRGGPNNTLYKPSPATSMNISCGSENAYRVVDN